MSGTRLIFACLSVVLFSAVPASAADSYLGTWKVTDAKADPWYNGNGAKPDIDPKLAHATIFFAKTSIKGPQPLGCKKVKYTISTIGPEDLFEGELESHKQDAATLGFKSDKIMSLNEGCVDANADIEMDFAFADNDTAVFELNNVIYTMKRVPAAKKP